MRKSGLEGGFFFIKYQSRVFHQYSLGILSNIPSIKHPSFTCVFLLKLGLKSVGFSGKCFASS
jgi:hypothetical protein